MANKITEKEKRQLHIMKKKIGYYKKNQISLISLINDLDALVDFLENINENWLDRFSNEWWRLELVYATIADEERELNEDEIKRINKALENIEKLIQEVNFLKEFHK